MANELKKPDYGIRAPIFILEGGWDESVSYTHLHETSDTAEKLDYPQFAEVVQGLSKLVISLANKP